MKFYIQTFGCQMNEYDSLRLEELLISQGHIKSDTYIDADLVILNTCSIREKATHKVYSMLGKINLEKQKIRLISQMSDIRNSLESVLGEVISSLESVKIECMSKLRRSVQEYSRLSEKQGTELHTGVRRVGEHHFLFITINKLF